MENIDSQTSPTVPCIFCRHPINPGDWDWKCQCCEHFNAHGSFFKNCETCGFSPARLPCPSCHREFDFMVLLGNYGIYEVSKLALYGLPDRVASIAGRLFTGVTFTFHYVVRSLHFHRLKRDEQDRLWFHAWMFSTNPPDLEKRFITPTFQRTKRMVILK